MLLVMLLKGILSKLDICQNMTPVNAGVETSDPRSVPESCFSRAPVHSTALPEKAPFLYQSPCNMFHTHSFIFNQKNISLLDSIYSVSFVKQGHLLVLHMDFWTSQ